MFFIIGAIFKNVTTDPSKNKWETSCLIQIYNLPLLSCNKTIKHTYQTKFSKTKYWNLSVTLHFDCHSQSISGKMVTGLEYSTTMRPHRRAGKHIRYCRFANMKNNAWFLWSFQNKQWSQKELSKWKYKYLNYWRNE